MVLPKYTNNLIYRNLIEIADNAGIKTEYVELNGSFGETEHSLNRIKMSNTDIYEDEEHASFVLAHEIAHILVREFYEHDGIMYENSHTGHKFFEADADKIGAALYSLAVMTYEQNQKKQFSTIPLE